MPYHRYILIDRNRISSVEEYRRLADAKRDVKALGHAVAKRIYEGDDDGYEIDDTELIWTPDGADTWPPKAA